MEEAFKPSGNIGHPVKLSWMASGLKSRQSRATNQLSSRPSLMTSSSFSRKVPRGKLAADSSADSSAGGVLSEDALPLKPATRLVCLSNQSPSREPPPSPPHLPPGTSSGSEASLAPWCFHSEHFICKEGIEPESVLRQRKAAAAATTAGADFKAPEGSLSSGGVRSL